MLQITSSLLAGLPNGYPSTPMRGVSGNVDMPLVGLGTWQYNSTVAAAAVKAAFSIGYRHVDTALEYKDQVGVGKALAESGVPRSEYFVTSKIPGAVNASAAATTAALDLSLKQLGLAQVDLMLIHWPGKDKASRKAQWLALEVWARQGKARAIGISHFCKIHLQEVLEIATLPVALNQNQYHVGMYGDTQPRLHDKAFNEAHGVVYMAYSSLCGPCDPPANKELISGPLVTEIGKAHNKSGPAVALRWIVQQGIPVIPKASDPAYLKEDFELFDFELSDAEMARLNAATTPAETGTPAHPDDAQDCAAEEALEVVEA